MKRILMIVLASGLCITTSCAHKKRTTPADVVVNDASIDKKHKAKEIAAKKDLDNKQLAYTCDVAGDKRLVTLDEGKAKCSVNYTKNGTANEVAWGQNSRDICKTAFSKIRTNIEGAGFKCQDGLQAEKKTAETAAL